VAIILRAQDLPSGQRLLLVFGDLTEEKVDAVVNAANAMLQHGGGVAGAILRRGGRAIQAESEAWVRAHGPARPDRPAITGPGVLPCKAIIHAVGPIWGEGDEDAKLRTAVQSSLALAEERRFSSIALRHQHGDFRLSQATGRASHPAGDPGFLRPPRAVRAQGNPLHADRPGNAGNLPGRVRRSLALFATRRK